MRKEGLTYARNSTANDVYPERNQSRIDVVPNISRAHSNGRTSSVVSHFVKLLHSNLNARRRAEPGIIRMSTTFHLHDEIRHGSKKGRKGDLQPIWSLSD